MPSRHLLSPQNESYRPPRRRKLMTETDYISPMAKIIAGQAVDFVDLPSCRAGTYFRYAAKVSKGASKERGKPFGAVSLSPLKSPLLSTDRGTPPHGKRAGAHAFKGAKALPATLAWLRFEALTARELVLEFDFVRFLAADALGASARRPNRGYATGRCPAPLARTAPGQCFGNQFTH